MSPVTHLLLSWPVGSAFPLAKRDCMLVAAAGVVPDVDGMGLLLDLWVNRGTANELAWSGQWPLNSWQNMLVTVAALAFVIFTAWKKGGSPVEIFSEWANAGFVDALRKRFGVPSDLQILEAGKR